MTPKEIILQHYRELGKLERQYPNSFCCLWNGVGSFFQYSLSKIDLLSNEEPLLFMWGDSAKVVLTSHRLHLFKSGVYYPFDLKDVNIKSCISGIIVCSGEYKSFKQVVLPIELFKTEGSGDRYLNHLNTIKKWHAKQERIQIAESITPTAHLMNSSPTRSINIFKTETNQGPVH